MMNKILSIVLILVVISFNLNGQNIELVKSVIGVAGNNQPSSGIKYAFTVGESAVINHSSGKVNLSEGFQQPTFKAIEPKIITDDSSIEVFPNPNNGDFTIRLFAKEKTDYKCRVFSILGIELYRQAISQEINDISLTSLPSGTYRIQVYNNNNNSIVKSFQIIK